MIVKVQVSLASSDNVTRVLIYNQSRTFEYVGGLNQDMVDVMAGRPKAFFEASMGGDGLSIGAEVPDPGW